jgi:hypothetical protein
MNPDLATFRRLFGALAELFDISCLYDTSIYNHTSQIAYNSWVGSPIDSTASLIPAFGSAPPVLGQHYYVPTPNATTTSYSPKWDFTSSGANKGDKKAYAIGKKVGDILSPRGNSSDGGAIDWLSVQVIEGDLASQVFRIDTIGGIQPSSVRTSVYVRCTIHLTDLTLSAVHSRFSPALGQVHRPILYVFFRSFELVLLILFRRVLWWFSLRRGTSYFTGISSLFFVL